MADGSDSGLRSKVRDQLTPQFWLTLIIALGGALSTYAVLGYRVTELEKKTEKTDQVSSKQGDRIASHDLDSLRLEDRLAAMQQTLSEIKVEQKEIKHELKSMAADNRKP